MIPQAPQYTAVSRYSMRTRFEIAMHGASRERLRAAGEAALDEVSRIEASLSFYSPESDVFRLNTMAAHQAIRVDARLFRLLQTAERIWEQTGGAFDVTVGPLMRAWGFTSGAGHKAEEEARQAAVSLTGMQHVQLDADDMSVRYDREGVEIDLGAIGKGCAVDAASEILRECGVTGALVHGGSSSVYAIGADAEGSAWRITVQSPSDPEASLGETTLQDASLSVSAPHGKSFVLEGREMGHVLDPRVGAPAEGALAAAVVGPSATEGDALSTALLVLGDAGPALMERIHPELSTLTALRSGAVQKRGRAWIQAG